MKTILGLLMVVFLMLVSSDGFSQPAPANQPNLEERYHPGLMCVEHGFGSSDSVYRSYNQGYAMNNSSPAQFLRLVCGMVAYEPALWSSSDDVKIKLAAGSGGASCRVRTRDWIGVFMGAIVSWNAGTISTKELPLPAIKGSTYWIECWVAHGAVVYSYSWEDNP